MVVPPPSSASNVDPASDTPAGRRRGTYAKTAQFRLDVLDAALDILAARGFDATTVQTIADRVGRSKAGLLHHFESRENLMLHIVQHRDEVNRQLFPPGEGFEATFDLVAHNATVPGLIALYTVTSALAASDTEDSDRRAFFSERYRRTREGFRRRIAIAQDAGNVRTDISASEAASLLIAAMDGLQVQWLLDPHIDMVAHLRTLIRMLEPTAP